jgi:hypothetical protein
MESHAGDDKHYVWVKVNSNEMFAHRSVDDGSDPPDSINIRYEHDDSPQRWNLSEDYSKIIQAFNKSDSKNIFIWLGIGKGMGTGNISDHAYISNNNSGPD